MGIGKAGARGDMFKKSISSEECSWASIGDIFKKLRSFGIAAIGSPIGGDGCPSFNEGTDATVTNGGEPGKELGGPTDDRMPFGFEGALFMRNRSLRECLAGERLRMRPGHLRGEHEGAVAARSDVLQHRHVGVGEIVDRDEAAHEHRLVSGALEQPYEGSVGASLQAAVDAASS